MLATLLLGLAIIADAVSHLQMWDLIVGFFLPVVLSFIVQHHWPDDLRAALAFVACLIAAVGTVLIQQGGWDWNDWVTSALTILITAIATYKGFWVKVAPQTHNGGAANAVNTTRSGT